MYYELRKEFFNIDSPDYDVLYRGSLEEIAAFLSAREEEKILDSKHIKLYAISEQEVSKTLLKSVL